MSAQIRHERSNYYTTLEHTQKGTLDVTPWQEWFLSCPLRAIEVSQDTAYRDILDLVERGTTRAHDRNPEKLIASRPLSSSWRPDQP